jgi:DNA recombination protein RmuC
MEHALWLALALILAAIGGGAALIILARRGTGSTKDSAEVAAAVASLASSQTRLVGQLDQLAGAVSQVSQDQTSRHAELARQLNDRLDAVSKRVGDTLTEQGTKTAESLGQLQLRLTTIDEAQKNIVELSGQVVSLQDILANKQARGAFGQIQMEDLVRKALPPSVYEFQHTLSNGKRSDCIIHLPQPPGSIVIDAKFPLEPYQALRNAKTEAEVKEAARQFRVALSKHIEDIASKYIVPGETAESALMFLPSEAVYAELHATFQDIVEKSHTARVYIVSPTTLMATLNTVRAVLKDARMREQAHLIQIEVGKLSNDVRLLGDRVGHLRTHFGLAEKDIKEIETSAQKITRTRERIEEVQLGESPTPEVLIEPQAAAPAVKLKSA